MTQYKTFSSTDLNLCATLSQLGFRIESVDKSNPAKAVFIIARDAELDITVEKYFARQLQVEPLAFSYCLRNLKTRIYHT